MKEERIRALMDATGGIREEYIEEAAQIRRKHALWIRLAAAAAALVLIIGGLLLWPESGNSEPIPFFAIRAYAADGSMQILDEVWESVVIASEKSKLFPEKRTYTFDISLGDYTGDPADFEEGKFLFKHNGKKLLPGEGDDEIIVEWLRSEDNGISGYRVTGCCDDYDWIDITIEDKNGIVIHQKKLWVEREGNNYRITTRISYTYRDDMTTDELIEEVLRQDYSTTLMLASSFDGYYSFVRGDTGFKILEQRPDAAEKLFERYMQFRTEFEAVKGEPDGDVYWIDFYSNSSLLTCMLSYDVYWDQLTREQQELYCTHGGWRAPEGMSTSFPGKYVFEFELNQEYGGWNVITVTYGDQTIVDAGRTENVQLFNTYIVGWFTEPTDFTITVTDQLGNLLYEEKMRITPVGNSYDIEVLETTE